MGGSLQPGPLLTLLAVTIFWPIVSRIDSSFHIFILVVDVSRLFMWNIVNDFAIFMCLIHDGVAQLCTLTNAVRIQGIIYACSCRASYQHVSLCLCERRVSCVSHLPFGESECVILVLL